MGQYSNVVTTNTGMRLIELSAQMEKPILFTRLDIGNGYPADGEDPKTYTGVINKQLACPNLKVAKITNPDVAQARWAVYFAFSNDSVSTGFYMQEIGLYARVYSLDYTDKGWNGYKGEEVLFGYAYAMKDDSGAIKADWLPDKATPLNTMEFVIHVSVGNASSVTCEVTNETLARAEDLSNHITDPDAHKDIFNKYVRIAGDTMTGDLIVPTVHGNLDGTAAMATSDANGHDISTSYFSRINDTAYPVDINQNLDKAIREGIYDITLDAGYGIGGDANQRYGRLLTFNKLLDSDGATDADWRWQIFLSTIGNILTRQKINGGAWTDWLRLLTSNDLSSITSSINNVKSQAGVIAGYVGNANAWWVKFGGTIPLIIQGGYDLGQSGNWPIAFPHALLGISGDYSGSGGDEDWGPSISGNRTGWNAGSSGSNLRVFGIGY